jgi:FkbM family methyltransferase
MMGVQDRAAELARLRSLPALVPAETELFDPPFRLMDGPSFVPQYEEIFINEIYSFPFDGIRPVIIDCGANIGLGILWWRNRWRNARIIAFEPDPEVFETLQFNLRYHEDLELHQAAVGDVDGLRLFYPQGSDAGRLDHRVAGSASELPVEVRSLATVLEQVDSVDLLKLDIEGAETAALVAAATSLSKVRRIFVEYHSFPDEPQRFGELLELLGQSGFRYYCETPMTIVRPFHGVPLNQGIDLQVNVFAWRAP